MQQIIIVMYIIW